MCIFPQSFIISINHDYINGLVRGNIETGNPSALVVSCRFPLKPIHWATEGLNQSFWPTDVVIQTAREICFFRFVQCGAEIAQLGAT